MNAQAPNGSGPVVIVFTGLPGTGKSTMADLTAQRIKAPSFAGDWLLGALAPHGIITNIERKVQLGVYFDLLERLVWRQLMLGQSAVVDGGMTDELAAQWQKLADRYHADLRIVECVCSDEAVHRSRLEGRRRGIPGWHEVGWDHVERIRREFPRLTVDRLIIDALRPVDENLREVLRYAVGDGSAPAPDRSARSD